jgi:hypothetical protein
MARKKKETKKEETFELNVPEDFVGEVIGTVSSGITPVVTGRVAPMTELFGNGDLNILRDKINEIIAKI